MEWSLIIVAALAGLAVVLYNRLVRNRNFVADAWAGIQVQLTKRHDLVPILVRTVKAYASHESSLHATVTALRTPDIVNEANAASTPETNLGESLAKIFAVAEDYPELQADKNFIQLNEQLIAIEGDIESARRYYNGCVRDYNNLIQSFPSNLVAGQFSFNEADFFKLRLPSVAANPEVDL